MHHRSEKDHDRDGWPARGTDWLRSRRTLAIAGAAALVALGALAFPGPRRADEPSATRPSAASLASVAAAGRAAAAGPGSATGTAAADGGAGREGTADGAAARQAIPADLPPVTPASFAVHVDALPAAERVARPAAIHGIYLNAWAAGSARKRAKLIALADRTEVNAFVVDVKDATGHVSYESSMALARKIGASQARVGDIRAFLAELRSHGIYPIARIVAFKDPVLAAARPDWAIRDTAGGLWHDRYGDTWVDAYDRRVWDYDIALAREAMELGFSEIQWDYVRFPDTPARQMRNAVFAAAAGRTKAQAISEFLRYSRDQLSDVGATVTADVFGLTTSAGSDMGIGQYWPMMVGATDALLPMVYPSHYRKGSYGIAYPNGSPYEIVKTALEHGLRRSEGVADAAEIRPWLQDFTLGRPRYGAAEVRAQIRAVYDVGLRDWILWNPGSDYTVAALAPAGGDAPAFDIPHFAPNAKPVTSIQRDGPRLLGTPIELPDTAGAVRR